MKNIILTMCMVLVCGAPAWAQTPTAVTAASGVSFTDSGNNATAVDGTPLISRYEIHFVASAGCAAVSAVNLGKPTPDGTGVMTAKPVAAFGTIQPNCSYTLVVAAIGPGGEADSAASVPFALVQPQVPTAPAKPTLLP